MALDKTSKQHIVGDLGEMTIKSILESKSHTVTMSVNQYDSTKDMIVNGKYRVEVKTQVPWFMKKMVTFASSQEKKMREVDYSFVIGYNNTLNKKHDWANKIWILKPDFNIALRYDKNGKNMFGVYVSECKEWNDTPTDVVRLLTRYTTSAFK